MGLFKIEGVRMNIIFYTWSKPYKINLCRVMSDGAFKAGHNCRTLGVFKGVDETADAAVFIGCNRVVREAFDAYREAGKHTIYIDKGYLRYREQGLVENREYYRVAVDSFQPSNYVMALGHDSSRWDEIRIPICRWREQGEFILYADVSKKYHDWFGTNPLVSQVDLNMLHSSRSVMYRSRNDKVSIYEELKKSWALVTRGSNAAVDALIYGVPVCVTGEHCVTLPLTWKNELRNIDQISLPSDEDRYRFFCGLAWCQFTLNELETKFAWEKIMERIES